MTPPVRTDRVGLLLDQLTDAVALSRARIDGLTTDELLWEPYPAMWSIRLRGQATSPDPIGTGAYVVDHDATLDPFAAGPMTTIAWRISHLASAFAGRWHWTFGEQTAAPNELIHATPDLSLLDDLWNEIDRWVTSIESTADDHLDEIGYSQYPDGLDAHLPFITIVRWMNRETIHHLAEIALLRDLYATVNP